jgi:hypothetical protein
MKILTDVEYHYPLLPYIENLGLWLHWAQVKSKIQNFTFCGFPNKQFDQYMMTMMTGNQ